VRNDYPSDLLPANLAAFRHQKGITLEQIAEATKIRLPYLQAIEKAEFDSLPGGLFATSYIRQYARAIDFDEGELLSYYNSRKGSAKNDGQQDFLARLVEAGLARRSKAKKRVR
jgi:cytoskeleton protein RodZ